MVSCWMRTDPFKCAILAVKPAGRVAGAGHRGCTVLVPVVVTVKLLSGQEAAEKAAEKALASWR